MVSKKQGMAEDEPLLTFDEAAEYLRVSRSTLYRVLRAGRLQGRKLGRRWLFYKSDLRDLPLPTSFVSAETVDPDQSAGSHAAVAAGRSSRPDRRDDVGSRGEVAR